MSAIASKNNRLGLDQIASGLARPHLFIRQIDK